MTIVWQKERAYQFLQKSWKKEQRFQALISSQQDFREPLSLEKEIFSSLVILDLLGQAEQLLGLRQQLLQYIDKQYREDNLFSFYENRALLGPDIDDTSLGVSLLFEKNIIEKRRALDSVNRVMGNSSEKGILAVFFPPSLREDRLDAVACANALYLVYLLGKEAEVETTENLLLSLLEEEDELISLLSPYYCSPDAFLFALSRSVSRFPAFRKKFAQALTNKLKNRIGKTEMLLDCAMRVIVAKSVGVENIAEAEKLKEAQNSDGSWPVLPFFKDGKDLDGVQDHYYGSQEISTAFCMRALENL